MKIQIGGYEVEIRAKAGYSTRVNKNDVTSLLNDICIAFSEAAEYNKMIGAVGFQNSQNRYAKDIYNALDAIGVYNDYK